MYALGSRFARPPPMVSLPYPHPPCFKSDNSHRDGAPWGRHPRNCPRFRRLKAAILVTVVSFYASHVRYVSKVPTVTGIRVVLIAVLTTVITFETSYRCRILNIFTVTVIGFVLILDQFYEPYPFVNLLETFYELL